VVKIATFAKHRIGNSGADSCKLNICNSIGHLCKCWADVFQMPHHRQYVAYNLYQIVEKYKANNELIGRRHFEINGILFLTMSYPTGQSKELVDRLIEDAAQIYMYKLNYKYEKIVVLGTPYDLSESKYGIIIQKEDASKEAKDYLENLCNQYGWFQDMKISKSDFKI
jgi:hypothetical protein